MTYKNCQKISNSTTSCLIQIQLTNERIRSMIISESQGRNENMDRKEIQQFLKEIKSERFLRECAISSYSLFQEVKPKIKTKADDYIVMKFCCKDIYESSLRKRYGRDIISKMETYHLSLQLYYCDVLEYFENHKNEIIQESNNTLKKYNHMTKNLTNRQKDELPNVMDVLLNNTSESKEEDITEEQFAVFLMDH